MMSRNAPAVREASFDTAAAASQTARVIHPDPVVRVGIAGGVGEGAPGLVDRDDRAGFVKHRDMGRQGIQGGAQQCLRLHVGRDQGRQAASLRRPCGGATPLRDPGCSTDEAIIGGEMVHSGLKLGCALLSLLGHMAHARGLPMATGV